MERHYAVGDSEVRLRVEPVGDGYRVVVGERSYDVVVRRANDGVLDLDVDGRRVRAVVAPDGARRLVALEGQVFTLEPVVRRGGRHADRGADTLTAAMPGQVVAVHVAPGDHVEKGQALVLLEAMKMELHVSAPHAARVRSVNVAAGDVVKRGQTLIELASAG
ncbi:MAG: biotin/lipoyl-containing protein [Anaerolineae bacterium]